MTFNFTKNRKIILSLAKRFFGDEDADVFSLGASCACAIHMERNGIRKFSGPFDWVGNPSFEDRFELIENGFKDYIAEPEFFEPTKAVDEKFAAYKNMKTMFTFRHDFPIGQSFEDSFTMVSDRYSRRINRLFKKLKSSKKTLLIYMSPQDKSLTYSRIYRSFRKITNALDKNAKLLILEHDSSKENSEIDIFKTENILRIRFEFLKPNTTTLIPRNKFCNDLLRQVPVKGARYTRVRRTLLRLVANIFPTRKMRYAFRKRFKLNNIF